jgi:amino acid transporter
VAILVANINFRKVVDMVIAVAILWANLAYLFVTASLLARRLQGWPSKDLPGLFSLGRWGLLINVLAVLWGVFTVINIAWPRSDPNTPDWYQTFGPLLFTAGLVLGGGIYYALVQRHKTGVLGEHRVASPAEHS